MKPEAQRIAIAKACGWTEIEPQRLTSGGGDYFTGKFHGLRKDGSRDYFVPDYPNDLNAMHEAENNLEGMNKAEFAVQLCRVAGKDWPNGIGGGSFTHVHATAAQRAEAFLRTVKKWKGE